MKYFAVIGNPITHSKSPDIHAAFAAQFDIDLSYIKLLGNTGDFAATADNFFERGTGANVTLPFKEDALRFADKLSEDAKLAGAVNTLSWQNGIIKGDNTDGVGLVTDIQRNHGCELAGKKVLIIGAGGAARGVILPIARQQAASITIANRTHTKALDLAKQFAEFAPATAAEMASLQLTYDVVINATSASLAGVEINLPKSIFGEQTLAYDMMYAHEPTPFMQFARANGTTVADGLGMLVEQAAKSFEIWHGVFPETRGVITDIRHQL